MGNGYFRTTETYKENKRNKDLLYNYVDRVRLSTNTLRDYKGPRPHCYGWRHKKSVLHLDLATSCHDAEETTNGLSNYWSENINKNLQHSRSLDNDKFTRDCSDELDVVKLYWPDLDTTNMKEHILTEQHTNVRRNLDISCERTWPYKYHSNILRKTNFMLDNKKSVPATILHAFDDEPYNLRRARSLSVIHEESFNDHRNLTANNTQRRLQLIPRAHLFNQSNQREHNRLFCGTRKLTQQSTHVKQKHLEHCEVNRKSECRCREEHHYQKHDWRQATDFMHQWYNNDKSDLESLNSDYFKNSLHQQQLQACELNRTNFDFDTMQQTMSLYADDKLPRMYQSKRRQNQIQIQRRRKQYKQQQLSYRDAGVRNDENSASDGSPTTLVVETTSHLEDYSTTSASEQEYNIAGMNDMEDDASNYELISLTTTTHTHTQMNHTETDLASDTETNYDDEKISTSYAELDKKQLNGDCNSLKSFGKLIAYDSVYLSSEEGSDDIIMETKKQLNQAEQTHTTNTNDNESKHKCQEEDNASLNCSEMELSVNNAHFIKNAFNKLNRQIAADDNVIVQKKTQCNSNLYKNQYHSLPDISIGRSLKVSESIDAKLRSSYNLIRYNCKSNIGRKSCKIKLRNDINNKKQISNGKQFRKRDNSVNMIKSLAKNEEIMKEQTASATKSEIKSVVEIEQNVNDNIEEKLLNATAAVTIKQENVNEQHEKSNNLVLENICESPKKLLEHRIKHLPITRVSSLRLQTNSYNRLQKSKTTHSTPSTLTKNCMETKRRPSVPPIDEEYLRKVDAVRAYWSKYAEQITNNENAQEHKIQENCETSNCITTTTNSSSSSATIVSMTPTTTTLVTSQNTRVLSDSESSSATQQFDHIRYKVLKSEQLICSGHKATQLDELLRKYLQEYSFQEFFAHNNVVIVEPVRSNMPPRPLSVRQENYTNKQSSTKNFMNNKKNNSIYAENQRKHDGIKRNFFFQPIRVNRELYENELPNPDTVRKVRKMFEQQQLLITNKENNISENKQQHVEDDSIENCCSGTEQQELEQTECLLAPDTLDTIEREQQVEDEDELQSSAEQVNWNLCNLTYDHFDQKLATALCEFAKRSYESAAEAQDTDKTKCIRVQDVIKRHNSNNNGCSKGTNINTREHIAPITTIKTTKFDTNNALDMATLANKNNNNYNRNFQLDETLDQLNTDDVLNVWPDMTKQLYMAYEQQNDAQNKLSVQMTTEVKFVGHRTEAPQEQQEEEEEEQQQQQQQLEKCEKVEIEIGKGKSTANTIQQYKTAGNLNKNNITLVDETVKRHYVANDKILFEHRKYDDIKFEQFEVYKHFPEDEICCNNNNNNISSVDKHNKTIDNIVNSSETRNTCSVKFNHLHLECVDDIGYDMTKSQSQINNFNNNTIQNRNNLNADKVNFNEEEEDVEHAQSETDCYDSLDDKL